MHCTRSKASAHLNVVVGWLMKSDATRSLEVLFTPAEFAALAARDLSHSTCVVLDVLRFTSTIVTALANGAAAIIPVSEISDALNLKRADPAVLLGGERNGLRIGAALTGGVEFDLGNSPREYSAERVSGRTIVTTTTNGSRAIRACAGAKAVYVGAFLNLGALVARLRSDHPANLLLVCSGTFDQAAYEDALAAGALCHMLWSEYETGEIADSAQIARQLWLGAGRDVTQVPRLSRNARRLLAVPELRDDVAFCLRLDFFDVVPRLDEHGRLVRAD